MAHVIDNYNGTISIGGGGRKIPNLRFADDINGSTGKKRELTKLVQNLDTAATKFGMKINAEKPNMTHKSTLYKEISRYRGRSWKQ